MGPRLKLLGISFLNSRKRKMPCRKNDMKLREGAEESRAGVSGRWLEVPFG